MRLPSKITPYKKSIFAMFPVILNYLENQDMTPAELYRKVKKKIPSIQEYSEILDCLYALNCIELRGEVLHYVERDSMR